MCTYISKWIQIRSKCMQLNSHWTSIETTWARCELAFKHTWGNVCPSGPYMSSRTPKWVQVSPRHSEWVQVNPSSYIKVSPEWSKWVQVNPIEPQRLWVRPGGSNYAQVSSSVSKWFIVTKLSPSDTHPPPTSYLISVGLTCNSIWLHTVRHESIGLHMAAGDSI